jgi:flavin reductase (DIM6/NTAB) family NADH-FMN oxidoreductase RutF
MFYRADTRDHGMEHDPFKAIVAPRPIGWIGTRGADGSRNLSPYSFFNIVSDRPKIVMFSSSGFKHSARNASETGEFTVNYVSGDLIDKMNASSAPVEYGVDEFALAGLVPVKGELVDAPYVGGARAVLECKVTQILRPIGLDGQEADSHMVFGQVIGIHIDEAIIRNGRVDMALARPVTRLGYMDYAETTDVFELARPTKG